MEDLYLSRLRSAYLGEFSGEVLLLELARLNETSTILCQKLHTLASLEHPMQRLLLSDGSVPAVDRNLAGDAHRASAVPVVEYFEQIAPRHI